MLWGGPANRAFVPRGGKADWVNSEGLFQWSTWKRRADGKAFIYKKQCDGWQSRWQDEVQQGSVERVFGVPP